jgi:hypothetical protein
MMTSKNKLRQSYNPFESDNVYDEMEISTKFKVYFISSVFVLSSVSGLPQIRHGSTRNRFSFEQFVNMSYLISN